ncbi:MAG: diphthamide synthesis protein [archaeon]
MEFELELDKAIQKIKKEKAKLVVIQLPEGLKPKATKIVDEIEGKTSVKCLIWIGTCFGACDVPNLSHINPKIDLLIQWGHSEFKK